jgi:hypothetical protein
MRPVGIVGCALLLVAAAAATLGVSCGSAPSPPQVSSFLQPRKVDFVCLHVNDANGNPIVPEPEPADMCPPLPPGWVGAPLPYHYYALVTQTARGELAAVDLTGGWVVDESRATPGVNLIPVGANPTDVAATPDGAHTYVTSADPSVPAVYGIDNRTILGDNQALTPRLPPLTSFSQIASCRLSQLPDAVVVIPFPAGAGDGGVGAGSDGGSAGSASYALALLLRGQGPGVPAQIAVIVPPTQLGGLEPCTVLGMSGAFSASLAQASLAPGPAWPDGVTFHDAGDLSATEPPLGPVQSCLPSPPSNSGGGTPPPEPTVDAGVDSGTSELGALDASDAGPSNAPFDAQAGSDALGVETDADEMDDGAASDAPAQPEPVDAVAAGPSGSSDAGPAPMASGLNYGPLSGPQPTAMILRDGTPPMVYVADGAIPLIHVIDLSNPAQPREVSSLLATSQAQPTRRVSIGGLALSPTTRDYRRYLYAIDTLDNGSVMVFDVTNPVPPPFTPPLQRPHPELNPFSPSDRITFPAPVAAVAFAYDEWPVPLQVDGAAPAQVGLLCNPSPNARLDSGAPGSGAAAGSFYCADQATVISPEGTFVQGFPSRLRGWFGFATLTNGNVAVIDLDDWDAPCRRPDPMTSTALTGALDWPEADAGGPTDLDPYHVPVAWPASLSPGALQNCVTQEPFYPVSVPNRPRSNFLLRNDPTSGIHIPYVLNTPELIDITGASVAPSPNEPVLLPTVLPTGFVDPSTYTSPVDPHDNYLGTGVDAAAPGDGGATIPSQEPGSVETVPGVRVSFDDPTAHVDQDWWVTYEGPLPATSPLVASIYSTTMYQDMTFSLAAALPPAGDAGADGGAGVAGGGFCEMGVEDWALGKQRATQVQGAITAITKAGGLPMVSALSAPPAPLGQWTSDYVEITDDIYPSNDCYWQEGLDGEGGLSGGCVTGYGAPADNVNSCDWANIPWPGLTSGKDAGQARYNLCTETFGPPDTQPNNQPPATSTLPIYSQADNYPLRDFPILEAYDDHLVVGRFAWNPSDPSCPTTIPERTTNRTVFAGPNGDGRDPDLHNAGYFQLAQCCFHNQAGFRIRTGGEWSVVGQQGLGFLHHVQTDSSSGRCTLSCDPHDVLRNGRTFDIPYGPTVGSNQCVPPTAQVDRANPLAFRNPMFSFVMWQGCNAQPPDDAGVVTPSCSTSGDHTTSQRGLSWRFSMQGGFTPLAFALGSTPVLPQSMRPLPNFQQLAIVDGASQGLILIDLHTLQFAHAPYF